MTQDRIRDTEFVMGDVKGQKVKQMIKRKAKSLFEENRVKRRTISSQGRPSLLDSEDEEFVAKCIEDKATYHGRQHDTVMYTNKRVKKSVLLDIANYKLSKEENKRLDLPTPFTTDHDLEILDLCKHGDIVGRAFFASKSPLKQRTMITRIHTFKEATFKTSSCLSFLTM